MTTDRRAERSRKALMSAFVALLLERGYANLTVGEVTARADVGRSTLYAHYGGLDGLLRESLARPSAHLAALVDHDLSPEALAPLLGHFQSQRRLNRMLFAPPVRAVWVRVLAELIEPRMAAILRAGAGRAPRLPVGSSPPRSPRARSP